MGGGETLQEWVFDDWVQMQQELGAYGDGYALPGEPPASMGRIDRPQEAEPVPQLQPAMDKVAAGFQERRDDETPHSISNSYGSSDSAGRDMDLTDMSDSGPDTGRIGRAPEDPSPRDPLTDARPIYLSHVDRPATWVAQGIRPSRVEPVEVPDSDDDTEDDTDAYTEYVPTPRKKGLLKKLKVKSILNATPRSSRSKKGGATSAAAASPPVPVV